MSWKIFKGVEAEGKYRGEHTIFVQGKAPYHNILEHFVENGCGHIYFGAQYKQFKLPSEIDWEVVNKLVKANMAITVDGIITGYDLVYFLQTELFKKSVFCNAIISTTRVEDIIAFANYEGPRQNIWFKLLNMETKTSVLLRLYDLQIPDKSLYDSDELLVEGE